MKSNGFHEVSKQDQDKKTNSKQAATGKISTFFSLSKKCALQKTNFLEENVRHHVTTE